MKNIKFLLGVALIAAAAVFSCSTEENDSELSGSISINPPSPSTWEELNAVYTGTEAVAYQWKLNGANASNDFSSGTTERFKAVKAGSYTVTVSAPGKNSKTSAAVTVADDDSLLTLAGELLIFADNEQDPAETAETGQTLTAIYSGAEQGILIEYQWFKDGEPIQPYAASNYDVYVPTEPGIYTVMISSVAYAPKPSSPVTVTGIALITITFDLNGANGENPTRIIAPGQEITVKEALPSPPEYNGFTFVGWYSARAGGSKIENENTFTESRTVYARWNFAGGAPYYDAETDTLIHENPLVTTGTNFAGTISPTDGTISFTGGAFNYQWPSGADFNAGDYAYCVVEFTLSSASGSGSGVLLKQRGTSTNYGGIDNVYPWLSNTSSTGITFPLFGAGDTGGFSIQYNGGETTIILRITRITFHKLDLHTITFDTDGGTAGNPATSSLNIHHSYTVANEKPGLFPGNPTKTDYTFIGWKNPEGNVVTATTPIMGDWTLTAQWMLTSEVPTPVDEVAENGTLFAASGGSAAAKFAYDDKQWWVFAKTPPGTPAAVAPFNGDAAAAYTAALEAAGTYTRVSYNLATLSDMWQSFPKVTITYDLIVVGGSELTLTVRNGTGGGSDPNVVESQTAAAGTDKTLTFNTSAISSGNLAFVKRNSGTDTLFLMRITKVELLIE